ncbi:general secretion pathway protein GspH [Pseudomonas sp. Leaf48]|jgi:type IV fimbrial biogenesis protein FimU|uniref:GspH/FimT family pseudopilin n=1 Tax=Pseudomonas sp. Leaf48 TaxID=1736221 RepID=UPI00072405D6|nr:GspH/FimT family pseudopilin [Pseudomonas sp. Leaf48]KQN43490.1 general secretion pathway protein GspH [Pseudomonas sp. Leaf48]
MDLRTKGFTLIELLIALAILSIMITLAAPAFSRSAQIARADTEIGDLQRGLNFARIEAINRGTTTRVRPTFSRGVWSGELTIYEGSGTLANVLRVVPVMSSGATLTLTSGVTEIDFNNLGGLSSSSRAVVISYVLGTQSRMLSVCLNGRIELAGSCG